jgi:hypothetical protein
VTDINYVAGISHLNPFIRFKIQGRFRFHFKKKPTLSSFCLVCQQHL